MAAVSLNNLHKTFDRTEAVRGVDLEIAKNEFLVLVGPSGCGKSTILRMIAGLEDITEGNIKIEGKIVNDIPPKDRDIAMVFQSYALYPHMTVHENMSFGLRLRKYSKGEINKRVLDAAKILSISELLNRKPRQLSGGQRQRVAMGRAIVRDPQVFLFDEPLSNLDAKMRGQMRTEIKKLHQHLKTTIVYVTHDQVEAMTLADRIVVMNNGKIEQVGTPDEMYSSPKTLFVASFIGSPAMNLIPCKILKNNNGFNLKIDNILLSIPDDRINRYKVLENKEALLGIRPEHLTNKKQNSHGLSENFKAKVKVIEPMGMDTMVYFDLAATEICARCEPKSVQEIDTNVFKDFSRSKVSVLSLPSLLIETFFSFISLFPIINKIGIFALLCSLILYPIFSFLKSNSTLKLFFL